MCDEQEVSTNIYSTTHRYQIHLNNRECKKYLNSVDVKRRILELVELVLYAHLAVFDLAYFLSKTKKKRYSEGSGMLSGNFGYRIIGG